MLSQFQSQDGNVFGGGNAQSDLPTIERKYFNDDVIANDEGLARGSGQYQHLHSSMNGCLLSVAAECGQGSFGDASDGFLLRGKVPLYPSGQGDRC
tara:strand:+ start:2109 stop:2396 length:288 start_codon:yes stop_codon:yes gene_type:complete